MISMNKAFFFKKEEKIPKWRFIDAKDKVLGRLATEIAEMLRGKDKAVYTPHSDAGDYVVVTNAEKIVLTGNKLNGMKGKIYSSYSGYMGGLKEICARDLLEKEPEQLIIKAVKGMLPKNKLSRQVIKKLKVYKGENHPHKAQIKNA